MIFFDLDDTLLNHGKAQKLAVLELHKTDPLLSKISAPDFFRVWKEFGASHYDRFQRGEADFPTQRRDRLVDVYGHFGIPLAAPAVDEKVAYHLSNYRKHWELFDDAKDCLDHLKSKHFPLGCITNGDGGLQREKLGDMNLKNSFNVIVISGEEGVHKPDAAIFLKAAELANREPKDCAYVGDRMLHDACAALSAGFYHAIWLNRDGEKQKIPQGLREIQNLHELKDFFRKD